MQIEIRRALAKDKLDLKTIKDYISIILDDIVREVRYPIIFDYKFKGVKYKKGVKR